MTHKEAGSTEASVAPDYSLTSKKRRTCCIDQKWIPHVLDTVPLVLQFADSAGSVPNTLGRLSKDYLPACRRPSRFSASFFAEEESCHLHNLSRLCTFHWNISHTSFRKTRTLCTLEIVWSNWTRLVTAAQFCKTPNWLLEFSEKDVVNSLSRS